MHKIHRMGRLFFLCAEASEMRPNVFIGSGSSQDRMRTIRALAHRLQQDFRIVPKVWTYVFPPTESTLNSLVDMSKQMDFAVFVLGPDDLIIKSPTGNPQGKGELVEGEIWAPRDNVIFEMGLLIGTLGKERCFAVLPEIPRLVYSERARRLHLLTDYLGTNYCTYIATKEPGLDLLDAVFAACQEIGNQIEKLGQRPKNAFRALFGSKTQAVVVYPHTIAKTSEIYTAEHRGGSLLTKDHYWGDDPKKKTEIAHFDDLRAVNAIAELCSRMEVKVIATTDGLEQPDIHSANTISFSIGLLNGLTRQAFEIIAEDTRGGIKICRNSRQLGEHSEGAEKREATDSMIEFNGRHYRGDLYPRESSSAPDADDEKCNPNFAILVRTFLRGGGGQPIPRFVCAGIEAPGTAAAGVYLENQWDELLKYYEDFGMDLEQDSLAVILQFWGGKAESSRPKVIRLSFFQPGRCDFYRYNPNTKGWERDEEPTDDKKPKQDQGSSDQISELDSVEPTIGLEPASKLHSTRRRRKTGGRS